MTPNQFQNSSSLNSQEFRRTGNTGNLSFCKLSYQEIDVLKLVTPKMSQIRVNKAVSLMITLSSLKGAAPA